MTDEYARRDWLVETSWLAENLNNPDIRIIDSTVIVERQNDKSWRNSSGRADYAKGHIPGAQFVDLLAGWQDPASPLKYMLPSPADFAAAAGALGISNDSRVIVYTTAVPFWATRLWWMFRAMGHDNVAILNGGLGKWQADGHPIVQEVQSFPAAAFNATLRAELVADKKAVRDALSGNDVTVFNALSRQLHTGESDLGYARPGRIAGSENFSALAFINKDDGTFLAAPELAAAAATMASTDSDGAICYCGGGIAATMSAFVLEILGQENVAVYDGSLEEWAGDPAMPMATG